MTRRFSLPMCAGSGASESAIWRPVISRMISSRSSDAVGRVSTKRPSRITVTWSVIW
ncbi:hypothetical protein KBTX_04377 [wastewater metagenome]|uniref:Uncharacterized protein n=2 Tax=unclassified sequences TaxID=12908 RepID=A0A5B8RG17_9ZZZZ|nr:hypothetical protein KBTEX_04377 [uncultured organism]